MKKKVSTSVTQLEIKEIPAAPRKSKNFNPDQVSITKSGFTIGQHVAAKLGLKKDDRIKWGEVGSWLLIAKGNGAGDVINFTNKHAHRLAGVNPRVQKDHLGFYELSKQQPNVADWFLLSKVE